MRLYRGEPPEMRHMPVAEVDGAQDGALPAWYETFPDGTYRDMAGLCKVATLEEIEAQDEAKVSPHENLRQTRDLLLPRLVSCEVDVSELEVEPAGLGALNY